jgi:hypothetical protein
MVTLAEVLTAYTAIVVTVLFFALTRQPKTPDQVADEKLRQEIMDKLTRAIDDIKATV